MAYAVISAPSMHAQWQQEPRARGFQSVTPCQIFVVRAPWLSGRRPLSRDRLLTAAPAPGLVLRVAGGIVRIGVLVVAGPDLGARLRRGIDPLIGVAAGERERHNRQDDRDSHSHAPVQWRRGRRAG